MVDPAHMSVLARPRQGVCGETGRTVHLVLSPSSTDTSGVVVAGCREIDVFGAVHSTLGATEHAQGHRA
jgi:hypothetical protein